MKSVIGIIIFLSFLLPNTVQAQRRGNVWYFGGGAGIHFNSGSPIPLPPSGMTATEGCASIADRVTGALLFYTNGLAVWNRESAIMANGSGLKGGLSSTQSALIVPAPRNDFRYYVFTSDPGIYEDVPHEGIHYSIVDMRGDKGYGEVVTKNILLLRPACEKLTAILHPDSQSVWIIAHGLSNNKFYSWLLTDTGIADPVVSAVGSVYDTGAGYMKASPDGSSIAAVMGGTGQVELFEFDSKTGIVSDAVCIRSEERISYGIHTYSYGLSFSPGSCRLYAQIGDTLFQYDVSDRDSIKILNSQKKIAVATRFSEQITLGMQIGPDRVLYLSKTGGSLGAIRYPDAVGLAAGYIPQAVELTSGTQGGAGLPNMVDGWFARDGGCAPQIEPFVRGDTTLCAGGIVRFSVPWNDAPGVPVQWRFPGGAPSYSTDTAVDVRYDTPGNWSVDVRWQNLSGEWDTALGTVVVHPLPVVRAVPDTAVCVGDAALLRAEGGVDYHWRPSKGLACDTCAETVARPESTTRYIVEAVDANGCRGYDTVQIAVHWKPEADIQGDTLVCAGDSVRLQAYGSDPGPGYSYRWKAAEVPDCDTCFAIVARPLGTTTYHVLVSNAYGCVAEDSVRITVRSGGGLQMSGDTAMCAGGSVVLSAAGAERYRWSPAEGLSCTDCDSPVATPSRSMTYYVVGTRSGEACPALDSVRVDVRAAPVIDAGNDTSICAGEGARLSASGGTRYQWDFSADLSCLDCADQVVYPAVTTTYYVRGMNESGCEGWDSVRVIVAESAVADAGETKAVCSGDSVRLAVDGGIGWQWEPGAGLSCTDCRDPMASPGATTLYRIRVVNAAGCLGEDSVLVVVDERVSVRARIGRNYRGMSDEPLVLSVELEKALGGVKVGELSVDLSYDGRVMRVAPESIKNLLPGTALEGWQVEVVSMESGQLRLKFRDVSGAGLLPSDTLFRFEGRLYLSSVRATEIPFRLDAPDGCVSFLTDPGRAELDSICGLNFRLIELGAAKYKEPTVSPNPGRERVRIEFSLGLEGETQLEIYNAMGVRMGILIHEYLRAGEYSVEWDAGRYPSGIYYYRLVSGGWNAEGEVRITR